jgi:hypothetical protein
MHLFPVWLQLRARATLRSFLVDLFGPKIELRGRVGTSEHMHAYMHAYISRSQKSDLSHSETQIAVNPKIIDVRYPLSTAFSTSLPLEIRLNHDNGRQSF